MYAKAIVVVALFAGVLVSAAEVSTQGQVADTSSTNYPSCGICMTMVGVIQDKTIVNSTISALDTVKNIAPTPVKRYAEHIIFVINTLKDVQPINICRDFKLCEPIPLVFSDAALGIGEN